MRKIVLVQQKEEIISRNIRGEKTLCKSKEEIFQEEKMEVS